MIEEVTKKTDGKPLFLRILIIIIVVCGYTLVFEM